MASEFFKLSADLITTHSSISELNAGTERPHIWQANAMEEFISNYKPIYGKFMNSPVKNSILKS